MTKDTVATPRAEHKTMQESWELPSALMLGTKGMRAAGEKFLPREPKETEKAFNRRLQRAVLMNEYGRNIKTLSGYVFARATEYRSGEDKIDLPDELEGVVVDVDREGTPLEEFAQELFEEGSAKGLAHVLVDFPENTGDGSAESDRELVLRPYFVLIKPEDLIGWRTAVVNSKRVLTQIRYRTWREEAAEEWGGETMVEQIRVRRLLAATDESGHASEEIVFEKSEKEDEDEWVQVGPATPIKMSEITLATYYAARSGVLTSKPPFEDLAWMNLRWWQSYSDQANILHIARVPILFGKNMDTGEDGEADQEVGANAMITASGDADLRWVEHSGAAVNAGRQDILDIEERMARMSIETYTVRKATTATAAGIDADQSMSLGQLMAVNLGQCITRALQFAAKWQDGEFDGAVEFNTAFGLRRADQATIGALNAARDRGDLSRQDYLEQLSKIKVVEDLNYEDNDARLQAEEDASLEDEVDPFEDEPEGGSGEGGSGEE